jgi:DNA-binding response OmpR family regulator
MMKAALRGGLEVPRLALKMPRKQVLYVERDERTLEATASALRGEFEVFVARNIDQAFEVADEIRYDADVIVIDLCDGMDFRGDSFIAEYRRRAQRETPIIITSGIPLGYHIGQSIRGAIFIAKPVDVLELVRQLHLLARHRPGSTTGSFGPASRTAA